MGMREKLIELLCKAHNAVTDKSLENDSEFGMTYAEQIETEADSLIANGVTIQKWIPVTERLPEMEEVAYKDKAEPSGYGKYFRSNNVLVYTDSGAFAFGILCNGDWDIECSYEYKCVTHWMPLPEPPREVE